jgi:hypothetical protein
MAAAMAVAAMGVVATAVAGVAAAVAAVVAVATDQFLAAPAGTTLPNRNDFFIGIPVKKSYHGLTLR